MLLLVSTSAWAQEQAPPSSPPVESAPEAQKNPSAPAAEIPSTSESESEGVFENYPPNENQEPTVQLRKEEEIATNQSPVDFLKLNLEDCIQMALLNNKEIKVADQDIQTAQWKLKEAQPRGVPVLEYEFTSAPAPRDVNDAVESFFSGDLTYFQKGKIGIGIPLYTFGKIKLAQDLAKTGIESEKEKKIDKQNDVIVKVKKLYFGLLLARDLRKLLDEASNHLGNEIERREHREENSSPKKPASSAKPNDDDADPVDLVRLKLYRYEVLSRLSEVKNKDYLAKEGLRIQMGIPASVPFDIDDQHLKPVDYTLKDFDYYLQLSQKFRPKSRQLNLALQAKEALYRLEKRRAAPDVGIGAGYEFGRTTNSISGLQLTDDYNDPFNYDRAGVGLRIKGEFNPKIYHAKVKQSQSEYFKMSMNKRAGDEGLELDLKEAYLGVVQARETLTNAELAMKTARQFVFITKSNIDIGVGEKKDYSDALQAYMVARGRFFEAIFNYNLTVASLEEKSGGIAIKNAN